MSFKHTHRDFPVLERYTYLNTGTFGPLLQRSLDALNEAAQAETTEGRCHPSYWDKLATLRDSVRGSLARLIGAKPHEVALTSSTTHGCHTVIGGLDIGPADEIVVTDIEHHTFVTGLRTSGATIRVARIQDAPVGGELEAIQKEVGPKTKLIGLSHVSWMDGRVLPLAQVSRLGPPVFVDGAQSVAAIPTDVASLGCDFLTFPGQKWALGPDASGGVFIREDWHDRLAVTLPSFYGHEPWRGQEIDIPLPGAQRYEAAGIPLPMLSAMDVALRYAADLGQERFTYTADLARDSLTKLADKFEVAGASGSSTLLSFDPGKNADETHESLSARDVVVRTVPSTNWVRISVGFWNSLEDIDHLIEGLI